MAVSFVRCQWLIAACDVVVIRPLQCSGIATDHSTTRAACHVGQLVGRLVLERAFTGVYRALLATLSHRIVAYNAFLAVHSFP